MRETQELKKKKKGENPKNYFEMANVCSISSNTHTTPNSKQPRTAFHKQRLERTDFQCTVRNKHQHFQRLPPRLDMRFGFMSLAEYPVNPS